MTFQRIILIVLDSVGAGAAPDAAAYGDSGANTLANTASAVGGMRLPNLQRLGLGNIIKIAGVPRALSPQAAFMQQTLRSTKHPELPEGEIQIELHVRGAENWSWADIKNNGAVTDPGVNPWNERQL